MTLQGEDGASFELSIEGYQFPDTLDNRWDSNWLFVRGHVRCSTGAWTFRDPCLTTFELQELADWLDSIAGAPPMSAECSFVEPNLALDYQSVPKPALVIRFAHESAPPWQLEDERFDGFALSFDVTQNGFLLAVTQLREVIKKFPERATTGGTA